MHKILKQISLIVLIAFFFTVVLGGSGWGKSLYGVSRENLGKLELSIPANMTTERSSEAVLDKNISIEASPLSLEATLKQKAQEKYWGRLSNAGILGGIGMLFWSVGTQSYKNTGGLWFLLSSYQLILKSEAEDDYEFYKKYGSDYQREKERQEKLSEGSGVDSMFVLIIGGLSAYAFVQYQSSIDPTYFIFPQGVVDVALAFIDGAIGSAIIGSFISTKIAGMLNDNKKKRK